MFVNATLKSLPRPLMIMITTALIIAISVAFFSVPMYAAAAVVSLAPTISLTAALPALTAAGAAALVFFLVKAGLPLARNIGEYVKQVCIKLKANDSEALVEELNTISDSESLSSESVSALNEAIEDVGQTISTADSWNSYNSICLSGTSANWFSTASNTIVHRNIQPTYLNIQFQSFGLGFDVIVTDSYGTSKEVGHYITNSYPDSFSFYYLPDTLTVSGKMLCGVVYEPTYYDNSVGYNEFYVQTPFSGTQPDNSLSLAAVLSAPISGYRPSSGSWVGNGADVASAVYSYPVAAQPSYPSYDSDQAAVYANNLSISGSTDVTISSDYAGSNTDPNGSEPSSNMITNAFSWAEGVIASILELLRSIIQKIQAIFDAYLPTCVSSALYISMLILICLWAFRLIIDR